MTSGDGQPYYGTQDGGGWNPAPYGGQPAGPPPQGPPYPGPHGQPYGYPYAPPRRTNGLAIASMVLGIVWIYWIGSVLALVFGYIAKRQIRERGDAGGGMATAGIVLGWVGIGFLTLGLVAAIATA
ncbi:DUF4190 domain-containing protein [Modestobacter sp. I12A-02662]|uniref:DUF4190 domain-containing protein n=1 Tax=Modestobacter sp. I12A-02662 TaxID=1730496 RepID=UPI0034DF5075